MNLGGHHEHERGSGPSHRQAGPHAAACRPPGRRARRAGRGVRGPAARPGVRGGGPVGGLPSADPQRHRPVEVAPDPPGVARARRGVGTMNAPLPPESSLGYLVNHLARLLALALRDRIEPHGVVPGQFAQLLALYESDGLTQSELCARVQIEQPTMANTLARMERDGLITRTPDPADQRRSLVRLTEHAHRLEPELVAAAQSVTAVPPGALPADKTTPFRGVRRAPPTTRGPARPRRDRPARTA